jgi:hypothetical protein
VAHRECAGSFLVDTRPASGTPFDTRFDVDSVGRFAIRCLVDRTCLDSRGSLPHELPPLLCRRLGPGRSRGAALQPRQHAADLHGLPGAPTTRGRNAAFVERPCNAPQRGYRPRRFNVRDRLHRLTRWGIPLVMMFRMSLNALEFAAGATNTYELAARITMGVILPGLKGATEAAPG